MEELADELVYNYLANSFGDEGITDVNFETITVSEKASAANKKFLGINNDLPLSIGEFYNKRRTLRRRCRNIMIIGAGASYDAYSAVPLGRQMIDSFKEIFVKKVSGIPFLKEKYEHEESEIRKLLIGDLDFENFLYLLSTFFVKQETLREEIKSHTGFRYCPNLFYEIVAHMLKHLFLDAVINFNFDEMLDQCIFEEMGKDNYHFVLSDGHTLSMKEMIVDGRIKAPIYIKPHGTFSHKSSLRFTKRHYLDMPLDIREMLAGLLSGERGEGKEVQRVNLICVGFDLASLEFNDIINEQLAPSSRIYHFLCEPAKTNEEIRKEKKEKIFDRHFKDFLTRSRHQGYEFEDIYHPVNLGALTTRDNVNEVTTPLAEVFSNIWRKAHSKFNHFNTPRSLARHELISYLFYNSSFSCNAREKEEAAFAREKMRENYDTSPKYYKDRVLVEIAIELLRNNGNVDVIELLRSRTGHYYEKYIWACNKYSTKIRKQNSIYDFLYEFTPDGEKPKSLNEEKQLQQTKLIFRIPPPQEADENDVWEKIRDNFRKPLDKIDKVLLNSEGNIISKDKYLDEFIESVKKANAKHKGKSVLGTTVLLYLLKSDFLSSLFLQNLLVNYPKTVYNGLVVLQEDGSYKYNLLLDELFRIFAKSNTNSFFNIQSRINDPTYKQWESFSVKSILHTNLVLSTDFKNIFKTKNWDCLLLVLDTGDSIKSIFKEHFEKYINSPEQNDNSGKMFFEDLKSKTIVLLCSMETVDQIHLLRNREYTTEGYKGTDFFVDRGDGDSGKEGKECKISVLMELHKDYFADFITERMNEGILSEKDLAEMQDFKNTIKNSLTIVFVPFWEHNQHCSIFLKSVDSKDEILKNVNENILLVNNENSKSAGGIRPKTDSPEYIYLYEGAYHMYRRGFSNSLSPLKIDGNSTGFKKEYLKRDIDKVLLLYFNVMCRGIAYQVQNAPSLWYPGAFIIDDLRFYRSWSPNQFFKRMQIFLGNLYTYSRDKHTKELR